MTSPEFQYQKLDTQPAANPRRFWLKSLYVLVALVLIGGTTLSAVTWQASVQEAARVSESLAYNDFLKEKEIVDQDLFYPGIWLDGIDLSGLTRAQAQAAVTELHALKESRVAVTLMIDDQSLILKARDLGWQDDTQAALDRAWNYARSSDAKTEREQIHQRYLLVDQLRTQPINFKVTQTYDHAIAQAAIRSFVTSQQTMARPARAVSFDVENGRFNLEERVIGRKTDPLVFQGLVFSELDQQHYDAKIAVESEKTTYGLTAEQLGADLALISTANTFAYAVDPERDNNLLKAAEYLNGKILQPGETFSFNETVGQRTAERGFMEAGAIQDGILQKELGGGVCQVNTTVMQAAMKSDYKLVERYPHSWPSSYTKVGLDATIDWGGADFKFTNNTEYPLAITATYVKPKVQVKIYGRKLEAGVSITLRSEETEIIPVEPPIYRANPELAPGQVVEVRAPHDGKRAIAYKVYKKNNEILKEEVLFKSYYRPLQGIYDVGPTLTQVNPSTSTTAAQGLQD